MFSPKIFDALLPVSLQYSKFKLEMYWWFFVYCDLLWGMLIWIFNFVDSKRLDWTVPKVKCAWIIKNNVVPICSQMISIPKNFLKVSSWITWTTFLICKLSPRERNNHFWNCYSCLNQVSTPGPGIHDISRVRSLRLVPKFSIFSWSWSVPILSKFCWSWFGLACGT